MQNFPYILAECEELNSSLYKPITSTQRIKYTCLDASVNYIALGSSSGGVYLFSREPCTFLQLIPLSEGALLRVSISPDEKTIALATVRSTVCLLSLTSTPKLIATSTEHAQEQITCLCWNDGGSEIYIGDTAGRISVMVLSIFTVSGMFQAPACTLMNLDSSIVQLSFSSSQLLVSTLTRCCICDTIEEQYKQIGNKGRNGEFGACFYKTVIDQCKGTPRAQTEERTERRKGTFNFIPSGESNVQVENNTKIFCARPGSRLWEVSTAGIVMKTHQFKDALAVPPIAVYGHSIKNPVHRNEAQDVWPPQSINFSHLFIIAQKYLFSFSSNGLYIIDPVNATIVLWNNEFTNISMTTIVDNKIYLMTSDGEFHCLDFDTIDTLILQLYNAKRYQECLSASYKYRSHIQKIIPSAEVNEFYNSKTNAEDLTENDMSVLLLPLIQQLKTNSDTCPVKLDSGIVLVHSGNANGKHAYGINRHSPSRLEDVPFNLEISKKLEELPLNSIALRAEKNREINCDSETPTEDNVDIRDIVKLDNEDRLNANNDTTQKIQLDLEPVYVLANAIKPTTSEIEMEKLITNIEEQIVIVKKRYETLTELENFTYELLRTAQLYYLNALLDNIPEELISTLNSNFIVRRLVIAFTELNAQDYQECTCGHPFPTTESLEPKFLNVGRAVLTKLAKENREECMNICKKVPYMWRVYLPMRVEEESVSDDVLLLCLQTKDTVALSLLLPSLDTIQWNSVVTNLREMRDGRCLYCGKLLTRGNCDVSINWTGVIREILDKHGPEGTIEFLRKLEATIGKVTFDKGIFRSLIFTKILYQHGMKRTIDFNKNSLQSSQYNTICSFKVCDQLGKIMEKDLSGSIDKDVFGNGAHHWGMHYKPKPLTCPCCTLFLQTPALLGNNGIAIFSCGHAYHVNCMIEKKLTACNLHS
ncbi:hypothetical protein KM043_004872 [Ampulex compressa]|nr:hypothetical protein KM043_004872 [Ampulex compressa]